MAGLDDISVGNFTELHYSLDNGTTYNPVENVQSLGAIPDEKNIIDVPEYNVNYMRKLTGSANAGPVEVTTNLHVGDASFNVLQAAYKDNTRIDWKIIYKDQEGGTKSEEITFKGQVASKSIGSEFDSVRTVTWSITIDGGVSDLQPSA